MREPLGLSRPQPPHCAGGAEAAAQRARPVRRPVPGGAGTRSALDVLPRRAVRTPRSTSRTRARRSSRCSPPRTRLIVSPLPTTSRPRGRRGGPPPLPRRVRTRLARARRGGDPRAGRRRARARRRRRHRRSRAPAPLPVGGARWAPRAGRDRVRGQPGHGELHGARSRPRGPGRPAWAPRSRRRARPGGVAGAQGAAQPGRGGDRCRKPRLPSRRGGCGLIRGAPVRARRAARSLPGPTPS